MSEYRPDHDTGGHTGRHHDALDDVAALPGVAKPDPIVVVDGVRRRFGGVDAVDVAHLEVQRNTITSLIGPNGAGKTTFFNLLTAFDQPDAGAWHLDGGSLAGIPAYRVARKGMVRTFQLTKTLNRLTVLENVMLAATDHPGETVRGALFSRWRGRERHVEAEARELLGRFGLSDKVDDYAGSMSGGQRKLLELTRAMMMHPEVIMLDEPMAGVNPALTQSILEHIKALRDRDGKTVIFIEHDMDVVQEISDWIVVLAEGRVIAEGRPADIAANEAVVAAYLGGHAANLAGGDR
ncbi:MAG TPA: ABC transporter ATP-binding protein [Ilumatobacter sp.]|nr:ABC transporter ATP-binding protein [Ilumatobacter sp.]